MTEFIGSTVAEGAKLEYFLSEKDGRYSVGVTKTTTEREWGSIPGGYEDAVACCRALLRGKVFPSTLLEILADWSDESYTEKKA